MIKIFSSYPTLKELVDKSENEEALRKHLKEIVYKNN
jgi:hypothetical protein